MVVCVYKSFEYNINGKHTHTPKHIHIYIYGICNIYRNRVHSIDVYTYIRKCGYYVYFACIFS